jgi:hypothetical protein
VLVWDEQYHILRMNGGVTHVLVWDKQYHILRMDDAPSTHATAVL